MAYNASRRPITVGFAVNVTVGETYDFVFATDTPQDLLLDLPLPAQKIHTTQILVFVTGGPASQ
jgi:hypothetical protein